MDRSEVYCSLSEMSVNTNNNHHFSHIRARLHQSYECLCYVHLGHVHLGQMRLRSRRIDAENGPFFFRWTNRLRRDVLWIDRPLRTDLEQGRQRWGNLRGAGAFNTLVNVLSATQSVMGRVRVRQADLTMRIVVSLSVNKGDERQ